MQAAAPHNGGARRTPERAEPGGTGHDRADPPAQPAVRRRAGARRDHPVRPVRAPVGTALAPAAPQRGALGVRVHRHHPGDGAAVRPAAPRLGRRPRRAPRGRPADRRRRAAPRAAHPGRAGLVLGPAGRHDARRVQLLPAGARRGLRLPVLGVPAAGVPARQQEREPADHVPGLPRRVRRAVRRAAHPQPVRRGAGRAGPARPGDTGRPAAARRQPDDAVEAAWRTVYTDPEFADLARLGEALLDTAERVTRWRQRHYSAVKRTMGGKPGTGGSSGLSWLKHSADQDVFPELWSVRNEL
ncbi:hypothetical protein KCH_24440 [Kitasatospora cheerisanensis KCTC 2395]|uniref:Tryptophan 2,3-dioxygenase n=1 Tax=Kitasatospora cheerisanensis KCTC 2395 TaxID=1348663 RepID=A0A066Z622_9ACTN|nr:hypothetical protein KCH_24440 [Kitasatospora cheerisanensis KCTC 2395]